MGGALGQGAVVQPVPEFEAWIVEAEKGNKDPIDFLQVMRQAGKSTSFQSRKLNRYAVHQWVLSVPERWRYVMQFDGAVQGILPCLFRRVIAPSRTKPLFSRGLDYKAFR